MNLFECLATQGTLTARDIKKCAWCRKRVVVAGQQSGKASPQMGQESNRAQSLPKRAV